MACADPEISILMDDKPDDVVGSLNRIAYSSTATVNPGIRLLESSKISTNTSKSHGFVRNAKQSLRHSQRKAGVERYRTNVNRQIAPSSCVSKTAGTDSC